MPSRLARFDRAGRVTAEISAASAGSESRGEPADHVEDHVGGAGQIEHRLEPVLDLGHRDRLPHVYDDCLCLYTPGQWDRSMQIATTIIPWTAEWLFHYELWKATDHWVGGGDVYAPSRPEGPTGSSAVWLR